MDRVRQVDVFLNDLVDVALCLIDQGLQAAIGSVGG
jgi:hypothetical protein